MRGHTTELPRAALRTRVGPYIALQELPKHLTNLLPFLLGSVLAVADSGRLDWAVFAVGLIGIFLLTDGTYIANEYFDYESDAANATRIGGDDHVGVTTTGGTRVLVKGLIPRRHALWMALTCFGLSIPLGILLQFGMDTGPLTIPLGALALLIGWFYTAPPVRAAYRGLGEVFIAVGQGAVVFGAYYIQQGVSATPLIVALPWFIALPALKILREFPDYESDRAHGKRGLTVILGRQQASRLYILLIGASILSFAAIWPLLRPQFAVLTLLPILMLGRSALIMLRGEWTDPVHLEKAAVSGFIGMLLVPGSLILAFLGQALL